MKEAWKLSDVMDKFMALSMVIQQFHSVFLFKKTH